MHILNYSKKNNIVKAVKEQGLDVWIASYGGSCSNTLVNVLQENNLKCKCDIWGDALCHAPVYVNLPIKTIYVYNDIRIALMSMYRRGPRIAHVNQKKLSNNMKYRDYSEENLLKLMISQFKNWIKHKDNSNIMFLKTEDLFKIDTKKRIEDFINVGSIEGLPIKYKKPSTSMDGISDIYIELFEKYKDDIEFVNSFNINSV